MDTNKTKIKSLIWRNEFYGAITGGGVAGMHRGMFSGFKNLGVDSVYVTSGLAQVPDYVKHYYIPYSQFYRNLPEVLTLPYIKKSYKELLKIIDIEKPDFLLQHHHDFNYGGSLIKRKTSLPFLLHCDFIQQWVKKNWGKLYFSSLLKQAEELQWEMADKIFVISSIAKKIMTEEYKVNADKIIINPNGVNTDFFKFSVESRELKRKELGLDNHFVNGFAGTFGLYHGAEYLAMSIKETIDKIPNSVFLFIGDGETRPNVIEIIKKNNLEKYVIFTGLVPFTEVPAYLSACDVLHSPCVNNEDNSEYFGSPTKLFEYMGIGLPIIASDVGQQSEVISDGHNGLLTSERAPAEISEAIYKIYQDEELRDKLSSNARKDAVEKWDWTNNANRILDAYKSISDR